VQAQAQHAHRLALGHLAHRGETDVRAIDDGHAAAPLHFDRLIRSDERPRVLIEADADREGVVGQRREQAPEPVALAEMLVDDETVGEPEPRRQAHAAGNDRGTVIPEGDHVFAQDAGTGTGAADRDALRVALADEPGDGCASQERGQAQLVAAGEKDAARLFEPAQAPAFLAVAAGIEIHDRDALGAELPEQLFVACSRLVHAAGRRNHDDVRPLPARGLHEAFENVPVILLVLGTADRDDPAACGAFRNPAGHCAAPAARFKFRRCRAARRRHPGRALRPG